MPKIPISQEGQVLQQGNPVPIGGTSEGRMLGEAVASTGQGMARLGIALFEHDRESNALRNKVQREAAEQEWKDHLVQAKLSAFDKIKQSSTDEDGKQIFQDFGDNNKEKLDEIASKISNQLVAQDFKNSANEFRRAAALDLQMAQRKRNDEVAGIQLNKIIDSKVEEVVKDPALLGYVKADILNTVQPLTNQSPAEFDQFQIGLERRLFEAAVGGFYREDREGGQDWQGARKYIQQVGGQMGIPEEERAKMVSESWQKQTASIKANELLVTTEEKALKRRLDTNSRNYLLLNGAKLEDPNTSPAERESILRDIPKQYYNGSINKETRDILLVDGTKAKQGTSDDTKLGFMKRVVDGGKGFPTTAEVVKAAQEFKLTKQDAQEIITLLKAHDESDVVKERMNDPRIKRIVERMRTEFRIDELQFITEMKPHEKTQAIREFNIKYTALTTLVAGSTKENFVRRAESFGYGVVATQGKTSEGVLAANKVHLRGIFDMKQFDQDPVGYATPKIKEAQQRLANAKKAGDKEGIKAANSEINAINAMVKAKGNDNRMKTIRERNTPAPTTTIPPEPKGWFESIKDKLRTKPAVDDMEN
jgi:hypothetical protein